MPKKEQIENHIAELTEDRDNQVAPIIVFVITFCIICVAVYIALKSGNYATGGAGFGIALVFLLGACIGIRNYVVLDKHIQELYRLLENIQDE